MRRIGSPIALAAGGGDNGTVSTVAPVLADYASATFVAGIDNPYFPFAVGTTWSYKGEEDGEIERPAIGVVLEEIVEGGSGRVELLETTAG